MLYERRAATLAASWGVALMVAACAGEPMPSLDAGTECPPDSAQCAAMGLQCGRVDLPDGTCIACGVCQWPSFCGGNGQANLCGCAPRSCAMLEAECGLVDDGCGAEIDCGRCQAPDSCAGGGLANRCGRVLDPGEACGDPRHACPESHACCPVDGGPRACVPGFSC